MDPGPGTCRSIFTGTGAIFFPGSQSTIAFGINNSGTRIVGAYTDGSDVVHGFQKVFISYTTIDPPNAILSFATGVNSGAADIVGRWDTLDDDNIVTTHGYLLQAGTYTMIDVPGAQSTIAWGVDDAHTIVGEYTDANDITHCFRLINQVFETIDVPGATATTCHAVVGSAVVGSYIDTTNTMHGFLMRP